MKYKVAFTGTAKQQLAMLEKPVARLITSWLTKNLHGSDVPMQNETAPLLSGQRRYRIGDCRLIADIQEDRIVILLLESKCRMEQSQKEHAVN